jgi:inosine/xanthosine triphosphate pyrophosphatase family protein
MFKFKKLVIATKNPAKVSYYKTILGEISDEVVGLDSFSIIDKPNESGTTAEENAEIKATFYTLKTGFPVFSEDEALYVDFLPESEQPGTHVRRINGKDEANDDQLIQHWEKAIAAVPVEKRTGKWRIAYCIATPEGKVKTIGLDHPIMFFSPTSKVRQPGWPMSSLEGSSLFKKPHSEQTEEEKEISKRRTAQELKKILLELL